MSVSSAMARCPFLHNIAQKHGEDYASTLAGSPGHPLGRKPLLAEDYDVDYSSTFNLFHGRGGVLPLPHLFRQEPVVLYPEEPEPASMKTQDMPRSACPFASNAAIGASASSASPVLSALPLASMSMSWGSNWFNIHHLFQQHIGRHRAQQRRAPNKPQQQPGGKSGGVTGPGLTGPGTPNAVSSSLADTGGKCPLRKALGPLAGFVFNKQGHLACPEPIIKMRAALAATRPVRELRPQALPIKLMAVALTTAMLNVPCGMWREHTEKFSSQWFIAVHATIPFIAMLRKAVIMPKYAILFTICSAIAGQAMGAKMERNRLLAEARQELGGLAKAVPVAVAPAPAARQAAAASSRQAAATLPMASMVLRTQPLERPLAAPALTESVAVGAGDLTAPFGRGAVAPLVVGDEEAGAAPSRGASGSVAQAQGLQFRVQMRSGRRLGARRESPVAVLVGRGRAGAAGRHAGGGEMAGAADGAILAPAIRC